MKTNVDASELAKFTHAAHDWWDQTSASFAALHKINPLRLQWLESMVTLPGKRVLDVGCGGGILAEAMSAKVAQGASGSVLGIDLSEASLKVAQLHALEVGASALSYRVISAEALAEQEAQSFDVVTCMEMLEHVPEPGAIVAACAQLVKPGGWVFFSTIHRQPKAFVQAIAAAEYLLGLIPRGTHEYAKFIRPAELVAWIRQTGLTPYAMQGLSYNPIMQRYALTADVGVNYFVAAQKMLG